MSCSTPAWCLTFCSGESRGALNHPRFGRQLMMGASRGWLTASSLTDIFYIVRRSSDLKSAQDSVRMCLKTFEICTVDRRALEVAEALPGSDFEDNLQIACATLADLDAIVIRDKDGFRDSLIHAFTPAELLTELNSTEE